MHADGPGLGDIRRGLLAVLTVGTAGVATAAFVHIITGNGVFAIDFPLTALYVALTLWLALGFWMSALGFAVLIGRRLQWLLSGAAPSPVRPEPLSGVPPGRTAILLPVYNEDPIRVFAGIRAMLDSLDATGRGDNFDFFVLSDTRHPDTWLREEAEWAALRASSEGTRPRLFYRRRTHNSSRKSGNIADFLERWGGNYDYMVVLDADSVMGGEAMVELVRRMDANPRAALIQIPPKPVNGRTLFARIQEFAADAYGPPAAAGLAWVMQDNCNFWGHNAIIRIEPFINHCDLPHLPGRAPLGGEILSHDFVEAALLRRAGWEIWLADDLGGSYEESPPTIIDFAKRDRRWCQGNLQHFRLIFAGGLHWSSRYFFATGVMAYVSSLIWLLFLLVGGTEIVNRYLTEPVYFQGEAPFPQWPVSFETEAMTLFAATMAALFLPKVMGLVLLVTDSVRRRRQGGAIRATLSVVLESLYSALLAPVMMLFHSGFVLSILLGTSVGWGPQRRGGAQAAFGEAVRDHALHTLIGVAATAAILYYVPDLFWWTSPILAGLLLSVPLSMLSSSVAAGQIARALGLFVTEEEGAPPPVLARLGDHMAEQVAHGHATGTDQPPFARVVTDPALNALHVGLLRAYGDQPPADQETVSALEAKVAAEGPAGLGIDERLLLLQDAEAMERLHMAVWTRWTGESRPRRAASGVE